MGFQQLAAYAYSEGNDIGDPRDNYTDYDPYGGYQKKYDLQVRLMTCVGGTGTANRVGGWIRRVLLSGYDRYW